MLRTAAVALLLAGLAAPARAVEPANTLKTLFEQLNRCLAPIRLARDTDVTIQFSLNRRGGLIGKPRITHAHWPKDGDAKAMAVSIAENFDRCLPATITDALGGAIAGQQINARLRGRPAEVKS